MLLIIKDQISTPYNIYHDTTIQVLNVVEPAIQWHNKLSYLFSSLQMEKLLNANGKSLKDFSCLPFPNFLEMSLFQNKFIVDELNYDIIKLIELLNALLNRLTKEQLGVYEKNHEISFFGRRIFLLMWLWQNWQDIFVENIVGSSKVTRKHCP